jgi:hypothetical protein
MARDANKTPPTYEQEDYHSMYYCTAEEWQQEYQNGHGVLAVKKSAKWGVTHFPVAEDGGRANETHMCCCSWAHTAATPCSVYGCTDCLPGGYQTEAVGDQAT